MKHGKLFLFVLLCWGLTAGFFIFGCGEDNDPEPPIRGCPSDADRDGVCDGQDECPATPLGNAVDAKGCIP